MSGAGDELSRKISSAQELGAVVRSMKALAAASIVQYERAVESLEEYDRAVQLGLSACLRRIEGPGGATPDKRPGAVGAILIGSDQGLVGRFNELLLEFALTRLGSLPSKLTWLWAVGERLETLIGDAVSNGAALPTPRPLPVPRSVQGIAPLVGRILIDIQSLRQRGDPAEVLVIYNHPQSAARCTPVARRLIPLDASWRNGLLRLPWPTRSLPQIVDDAGITLDAFIREYLFVRLFQGCAESLASENACRLAAMLRAEKNIRGILEELRATFHRTRQECIDEELFEVVAGFESLSRHGAPRSEIRRGPD